MLKINNIKVPLIHSEQDIKNHLSHTMRVKPSQIACFEIIKRSVDCRDKGDIKYVLSLAVQLLDEDKYLKFNPKAESSRYTKPPTDIEYLLDGVRVFPRKRPVVVGSGPAGMFCALTLALAGAKPIVLERGQSVTERANTVDKFWKSGKLDTSSNIQFGEGGAGTFSDGKLNTGIGSDKINIVLSEFVKAGAPSEIMWQAKPHIGTDILVDCVQNIRNRIVELGGEYRFQHTLVDIKKNMGQLSSIVVDSPQGRYELDTDICVLAIGHSARDTFEMLSGKVAIEQKAFSMGVRVEHLQSDINKAQYGKNIPALGASDYKLVTHLDNGRSCYTFCMCPGGYVIPATSEEDCVVTNGMSYHARDGVNANSALLVGVGTEDFHSDNVLAGVELQRKYERAAYNVSHSYKAPCQKVGDLMRYKESSSLGRVQPTYNLGVELCDLSSCLPSYIVESLRLGIKAFDRKIKGFADDEAILTGVESRSSSPIRILRDERGNSSIQGLIPCGEGAGYAGGITSACVDGITMALKAIRQL